MVFLAPIELKTDCDRLTRDNMPSFLNKTNRLESLQLLICATS